MLLVLAVILVGVIGVHFSSGMYKMLPATLDKSVPVVPFEDWKEFRSDGGHFTVSFPAIAQHATENLPDPKTHQKRRYDMYVAEKNNGSVFMVSLITYVDEKSISTPKKILKETLEEMVAANPENKILSVNEANYLNHEAIGFSLENKEARVEAKAFIVGNTLYLISYIASLDNYNKDEFRYFLSSFHLL
jgi:hypothetical protein